MEEVTSVRSHTDEDKQGRPGKAKVAVQVAVEMQTDGQVYVRSMKSVRPTEHRES